MGRGAIIHFAFEYDTKIMNPLFMVCFDQLNPISFACAIFINVPISQSEEKKANMFGWSIHRRIFLCSYC